MTVPALAAKSEKDSLPPLVQVLQETQAIDAEMVVAAAELAYMSANTKRDSYTLQELVDRGYLDAKLSDEQAITMVVRTENGAFTYIP